MAGQSLLLLLLGFRILQTAGYGFKYPRGSDELHRGQLMNITWDTVDEYVDLYLSPGYSIGGVPSTPDLLTTSKPCLPPLNISMPKFSRKSIKQWMVPMANPLKPFFRLLISLLNATDEQYDRNACYDH
jgi:hypothetical protein